MKRWLSFILTLLILVSVVLGLAHLVEGSIEGSDVRTYVMVIDRSASMAHTDDKGVSCLRAAQRLIRQRLELVPDSVALVLVAYDNRPEIVQPSSLNRREFLSRLDQVEVRPIAGNSVTAFDTALLLAELDTPAVIVHVSDFADDLSSIDLFDGVLLEEIDVSLKDSVNVGITSFQVRSTPLEPNGYDVYTQVALNRSAPQPAKVELELLVGELPLHLRRFDLTPGESRNLVFQVQGFSGEVMRIEVSADGDTFAMDDTVLSPLPEAEVLVGVWIRENDHADAFTSLALSSIQDSGNWPILSGTPKDWPLDRDADVVIFDGWLPESWPTSIPAIVINPPASVGPIQARRLDQAIPYDSLRVGNSDHPVLFRVSSSRLALTQTAQIRVEGSIEPLWLAGRDPLLAAGEVDGQRLVIMGLSPQLSERFPFTASFPLLLGNALLWVIEGSANQSLRLKNLSTGEFVEGASEGLIWMDWHRNQLRESRVAVPEGGVFELDRIGLWRSDSGPSGTSHLVLVAESDLPGARVNSEDQLPKPLAQTSSSSFPRIFLMVMVITLLVESWLFHRHSVF